ncbi:TPA: transposase [Escherichia coli]|nr:transposase [Escherichia coli]
MRVIVILAFDNHTNGSLTDLRGKAHIFSHPVYLSLKEFSLQDSRGDSQCLHSRIANIRRDYLHKVTTTISKNHAMIVIEDLKVSNMSKSTAGTVSQPGRNVRAKSGLNRSILRAGMKCAADLSTSSSGVVVRCLLFRQRTQASVARAVVIQRKKTA